MIVEEISIQKEIPRFSPYAPFVFSYRVNVVSLASFWTDIFLAEDETTSAKLFIINVIANYLDSLDHVLSLNSCIATFETWTFDTVNQMLYINVGLGYNPLWDIFEYMQVKGFCDTSVIYIDDIEYLPLIKTAPAVSAEQDLINYDKLAMTTGSTELINANHELDYMKSTALFSNDVRQYFLDYTGVQEYSRTSLVPISTLLVNNISVSKISATVDLIDQRNAMNKTVPINTFTADDYPNISDDISGMVIPLMFGTVKSVKALCTNGELTSGDVAYRIAESITSIGTVQVYLSDTWTTVVPSSVSLSTGEVILASANGREGSKLPACRVLGATGVVISNVADVIVYLDNIANGITFIDSFYDVSEWDSESASLGTVGVYINTETELFEIIRALQEGSNNRFRYEFNANGLRTLRLDNPSRSSIMYIPWVDIFSDEIIMYTDRDTIAAFIKINYDKNYYESEYLSVTNGSAEDSIAKYAREKPTIAFDTFLTTKENAAARAALEASRLGAIRRFTDITLSGISYLTLRIYDIITIELFDDDNEWYGVWKCQVLKTEPDIVKKMISVKLLLVEQVATITAGYKVKIGDTGDIKIGETDKLKAGKHE